MPTTSTPLAEYSEFLSVAQAARVTGKSTKTIMRWINAGRLAFEQPGGERCSILIPKQTLIDKINYPYNRKTGGYSAE